MCCWCTGGGRSGACAAGGFPASTHARRAAGASALRRYGHRLKGICLQLRGGGTAFSAAVQRVVEGGCLFGCTCRMLYQVGLDAIHRVNQRFG